MDTPDLQQQHLDQAIAQAMGGEAPVVDPADAIAHMAIPIHDGNEFPANCHAEERTNPEGWAHPVKAAADASADELKRHARYLEWRAGVLTEEATELRSLAETR